MTENRLPFETRNGKYIGYRGINSPSQRKPDFFGTEGVGIYIATSIEDASFFGDVYVVTFDPPKKVVAAKLLPIFHIEKDECWNAIVGEMNAADDDWVKAHKIAAKHLNLKTWPEVDNAIDEGNLQRTLTKILLKWGYDAVWTGDWIVLLDTSLCKSMEKLNDIYIKQ